MTKFLNDIVPAYHDEHGMDLAHYLDTTVTKFLAANDVSVTKFMDQRSNDVTVTKFLHGSGGANDITVTKFLDTAMNQYLDTTVTKFLDNDISVTKFLAQANNDVTVTKFLDSAVSHFLEQNDITVTKFLAENDISVTKFLQNDLAVTKYLGTASTRFLETNDITVTKFLDTTVTKFLANANETAVTKYLDQNDISVTKFLEMVITNFLLDDQAVENLLMPDKENELLPNDYVEVKFLEADNGDISVTKFLQNDYDEYAAGEEGHYLDEDDEEDGEYGDHRFESENYLLDNDTLDNGKRKRKAKNGKKKKKSSKGGEGDYDPHEVIVHFQNNLMPEHRQPHHDYYLQ